MSLASGNFSPQMVHSNCPFCETDDAMALYNTTNFPRIDLESVPTRIVMCRRCSFVYTDPKPALSEMENYYAHSPVASGQVYHESTAGSVFEKVTVQRGKYILSHLKKKNSRFLDVGYGRGDLLGWMGENVDFTLFGLDPSIKNSKLDDHPEIRISHTMLERPDLPTEFYNMDGIALFSVLEHVFNPKQFLKKLKDLLKPEGLLFVEVPDVRKATPSLVESFDYEHVSHFSSFTLERMMKNVGFSILHRDDAALEEGRIRVCVTPVKKTTFPVEKISDIERDNVLRIFHEYKRNKQRIEREFVSRIQPLYEEWKKNKSRVAIYGAGGHTLHLLKLIDISDGVCCVIDTDPKKRGDNFLGWSIYNPDQIKALELDVILISSFSFEDEIYERIKGYQDKGTSILRIYS